MEIDQLTVTSISLTFRMKTSPHESDDLVPLDTPIIVFLDSVTVIERHTLSYDFNDDTSNSPVRSACSVATWI